MRAATTLLGCGLMLLARPSSAEEVRIVAFGAPPLELRVPADMKEVEHERDRLRFGATESGALIAHIAPAAELIDPQALRETVTALERQPNTRVLERMLVDIHGRPALKIVSEVGADVRNLQYRCLVDSEHEALIVYALPAKRFEALRHELEKIETPTNRFANADHARGITPEGQIGFPGVVVPARWRIIGSDGKRIEIPNRQHSEVVEMTIAGAQVIVNPAADGKGEALQTTLLPEGRLDTAFVDLEVTAIRETLARVKVLDRRVLRLSISDVPAQKLVLSYDMPDGHPMTGLVYFATDELGRNWRMMYTLRREHAGPWRSRLERIEATSPPNH